MSVFLEYLNFVIVTNPDDVAFPQNNVANSTLFMLSLSTVTSESITGITDTLSNTWAQVHDETIGSFRLEIWKAPNTGGAGANTATITYSAFTGGSKRVWLIEVIGNITLSNGPSNTLNTASPVDPLPGATLTVDTEGIAFCIIGTDSSYTFQEWDDFWEDLGGGSTSRACYKNINSKTTSLVPALDASTTESGESLTAAFYDSPSGGGEASSVF